MGRKNVFYWQNSLKIKCKHQFVIRPKIIKCNDNILFYLYFYIQTSTCLLFIIFVIALLIIFVWSNTIVICLDRCFIGWCTFFIKWSNAIIHYYQVYYFIPELIQVRNYAQTALLWIEDAFFIYIPLVCKSFYEKVVDFLYHY